MSVTTTENERPQTNAANLSAPLTNAGKLLASLQKELNQALLSCAQELLESIGSQSITLDPAAHEGFQEELAGLDVSLKGSNGGVDSLDAASNAVKALEKYNIRTKTLVQLQSAEMQTVLALLNDGLALLANGREQCDRLFQSVDHLISATQEDRGLRGFKNALTNFIHELKGEMPSVVAAAGAPATEEPGQLKKTEKPNYKEDTVTGCPMRDEAERRIASAHQSGKSTWALVCVVDRFSSLCNRFGFSVGDQVLQLYSVHLAEEFHETEKVFRWAGPSFVVLLERDGSAQRVRDSIAPLATKRIEKHVQVGKRSVLVPISAIWEVYKVAGPDAPDDGPKRIDAFVSEQVKRGAGLGRGSFTA